MICACRRIYFPEKVKKERRLNLKAQKNIRNSVTNLPKRAGNCNLTDIPKTKKKVREIQNTQIVKVLTFFVL